MRNRLTVLLREWCPHFPGWGRARPFLEVTRCFRVEFEPYLLGMSVIL